MKGKQHTWRESWEIYRWRSKKRCNNHDM